VNNLKEIEQILEFNLSLPWKEKLGILDE